MKAALPVVAIVGRPNVGKSTLFNRMLGRRSAIVEDLPGVTRDRNYGKAEHEGKPFLLVDTGGFEARPQDPLIRQVRDQARLAVDEAEVVILVVDGVAGPTSVDGELAELLRRSGKRLLLAVNKIDSARREEREFLAEFHRLGLPEVFAVSGEHGRGVEDLLDAATRDFPREARRAQPEDEDEGGEGEGEEERPAPGPDAPVRLAIIGRPNVGKSTLLNSLLGEERFVTSPVAGTTRDPVDAEVMVNGRRFVLTDTAGIRRKRSISLQVEGYSVVRALRAAEASDVVVLLLDATELAVEQDARIAGLAEEQQKPIVVVVNKWDLAPAGSTEQAFREQLAWRMPFLAFAPVIFTTAITGERVRRVLDVAGNLFRQSNVRVPTPRLNKLLEEIAAHHGLPVVRGARARVYYVAQTGVAPPTFVVQTNRPDLVPPEYRRYVVNRIREVFDLQVPIRLVMKRKASLRRPAAPARAKAKAAPKRKAVRRGRSPRRR